MAMLPYKSKLRISTLIVRLSLAVLGLLLFIVGMLAGIGLAINHNSEVVPLIFCIVCITTGVLIMRATAWNIHQYIIREGYLEIRILGGVKKITYPRAALKGFNDLRLLVENESGGIGIVTTENKIIRILELEVSHFPEFIEHLQFLVPWDHSLRVSASVSGTKH